MKEPQESGPYREKFEIGKKNITGNQNVSKIRFVNNLRLTPLYD
jgi:hypothetical protein